MRLLNVLIGETTVTVLSVYTVCNDFYEDLVCVMTDLGVQEVIVPCGVWNGNEGVNGRHGYREFT